MQMLYIASIKLHLGTENLLYSNTCRSDVVKHLKAQILQNSINLAYSHCLALGPIAGPGLVMELHMRSIHGFYTHVHVY